MKLALIPCYNEEKTIAKVIVDCEDFVDEIVVCDDGSTDATARIAEALGIVLLRHETNEGKGEALRSLFLKAIEMRADQVVTLDGDGQHDPKDIQRLLDGLHESDMVIGTRSSIPWVRNVGNKMLSGFDGFDTQSGFRAYDGSVLHKIIPSERGMSADLEIFNLARDNGLRILPVPITADYGVPSPSKANKPVHFAEVMTGRVNMALVKHPIAYMVIPSAVILLAGVYFAVLDFSTLLSQGLGSTLLIEVGLFGLQTGTIIWLVLAVSRRNPR